MMLRSLSLLVLVWCSVLSEAKSDDNVEEAAFPVLVSGIKDYLGNGRKTGSFERAMEQYQLNGLFRQEERNDYNNNELCFLCNLVVDLVLLELRNNGTMEEVANEVLVICAGLGIETEEVCRGVITSNVPIIWYIARNNDKVDGKRVCSLVLQEKACDKGDNYEWTITIPDGNTVDRRQPNTSSTFNIIQISDFHYDPQYEPNKNAKCKEPLCCQADHTDPLVQEDSCAYWTEYRNADPPWHLIQETLNQINQHDFDYIYFTGDVISHRVWSTSVENNTRDLKKVFGAFREQFSVSVFPIFGNHEPHPLNVWSSEGETDAALATSWLYRLAAEEWSQWLPEDALETVGKGGFYTVSPRDGFRIVVLNSNVCYTFNWWLINEDFDPYGQLQWLVGVLAEAERNGESVHLLSHIPSGHPDCLGVWSREFNKIVARFANTITAQFNGHTHKDQLNVFYNDSSENQVINVAFNGASVTTYNLANPSYKEYRVDSASFSVVDVEEWTFNLTEANLSPTSPVGWYKLYSFQEAFGMKSLQPDQFDDLLVRMATDHTLLDRYYEFKVRKGDLALAQGCDDACKISNLCEIAISQYQNTKQCNRLTQIYNKNL